MQRNTIRVFLVLILILLAVIAPVIFSGYSELEKASTSNTYNEAAQHYESAAQRIPWRADLFELSGHAYYHAQEYINAGAAYQKAFERSALSSEGWVAWGDVTYLNKNPQGATDIWEQALKLNNPSEQLYSRLAQTYQETGDHPKAADFLQRYVSIHSEDASAHYRLGLLLTLSDQNTALSELITASQLDPQLDPAVQTLRTALNLASLNDSPSERFVIIGRGLGLIEEWSLARAAFESAVKADEKNAEALAWLAEANQHIGVVLSGEALSTLAPDASAGEGQSGGDRLDQALSLKPNSSVIRGLRGLYFQRSGNFRQALEEFQYAARLEPDNPAWQVSIGEAHSKLGDLIRALEAYQHATTLAPEDANYWRLLATFCAQNGVYLRDVGVPAAQRVVIMSKDDPMAQDLLGWLLLLDSRYDDAERHLTRALELDPQNASAHLHLAMVYLQKDDRAAAYDHLILARDLGNGEAEALLKQYFP
ncbi:MAG: tetratricopeptide repeat protein [Anaerolineae bacterium]|nr:tetratricopeptide repeat protein [Anaerolineae bacterium]